MRTSLSQLLFSIKLLLVITFLNIFTMTINVVAVFLNSHNISALIFALLLSLCNLIVAFSVNNELGNW